MSNFSMEKFIRIQSEGRQFLLSEIGLFLSMRLAAMKMCPG